MKDIHQMFIKYCNFLAYRSFLKEKVPVNTRNTTLNTFFLLGFTPCEAEQPLRGMELQEKEAHKYYNIQKNCLETTCS